MARLRDGPLTLPILPDVKKMPLGKLSKQQIARGFEALEEVEAALKAPTDSGRSLEALEKEMATHSSVLAWRIPGTGDPGGLLSMGSHRVRHD